MLTGLRLMSKGSSRLVCALGAAASMVAALLPAAESGAATGGSSCSQPSPAGIRTIALTNQGHRRPFLLYVPRAYRRDDRVPLVFDLHGSGGNGAQQLALSQIEPLADRQRFAVVAPDGAVPLGSSGYDWNVPGVPLLGGAPVPSGTPNDERYLIAVLDKTERTICVDSHHVYMTGFSGGARMTSQMACDHSTLFAAFAPVAGLRAGVPVRRRGKWTPAAWSCRPRLPVPIMTFHGTADPVNPYSGDDDPRWGYSVMIALKRWAVLDHCRRGAVSSQVTETTTLIRYIHCKGGASVSLYRSAGAGHSWPGSPPIGFGPADTTIHATNVIWRFFRTYRR